MVRRRTSAPVAGASASGSWPRPPVRPANTGPVTGGAVARAARAASSRLRERGDRADQLRQRGLQAQQVGPPGVDAAEERVDEPLDHLAAEPPADQLADRDVLGHRAAGEQQVQRDPVEPARRQQPGPGQRREVGRHPEQGPGRQRAQAAPAPHLGGAGRGRDRLQAGRREQGQPLRHPAQQRVGALVDGPAGDLAAGHLAAEPATGLQQHDARVRALPADLERGRQPGDAAPDDGDDEGLRHGASVGTVAVP